MILQFKVRNFLSIKEEQTLSFEATADDSLEDVYVVRKGKTPVLKLGIIFGPNASGKSNILKALDYLLQFTLKQKVNKEEKTAFTPFLLNEESIKEPGFFELSFFVGETLYIYTLELNLDYVVSEKLQYYPGNKVAEFFTRTYNRDTDLSEISFGSTIKIKAQEKTSLQSLATRNISLFAAYAKLNMHFPQLEEPYQYFRTKSLPLVTPKTDLKQWTTDYIEKTLPLKGFILDLLNNVDIKVNDILIETESGKISDEMASNFIKVVGEDTNKGISIEGSFSRKIINFIHTDAQGNQVAFSMDWESSGTNKLYGMGGMMYASITEDRILLIDELENALHPDLVIHFINTFLTNSRDAQLVCTTHDINILSEKDSLRRDVIWFTQKDKSGATELYCLAEFSPRSHSSFINAYKAGKFGAKPKLGTLYFENELHGETN